MERRDNHYGCLICLRYIGDIHSDIQSGCAGDHIGDRWILYASGHNQNLNIRVSETADPEIINRYITHFANIPNDSIDKVKLGMAVMHKFNQQNTNVNVVIGMDKNVNIDLVGLSDEDEETDGEIIDIPNRK